MEISRVTTLGIGAFSRRGTTNKDSFDPLHEEEFSEPVPAAGGIAPLGQRPISGLDSFAREQVCNLVRQVFVPGWPKSVRQVVFSPVDEETDISAICAQVGQVIATEESRTVCVVEVNSRQAADMFAQTGYSSGEQEKFSPSGNLWCTPMDVLLSDSDTRIPSGLLRNRLAELREKFDFTLLQGPAAGRYSEAALLGRLCDGVILVLEANSTRRLAALKAKEKLVAANARLLGIVLTERTFPIPEALYRKL
jgi:hypothetical protein